jgi:lipoprotein-releasing system ATP-binding protein
MSDLIVRDLCKVYPNPRQDVVVLDHVSFELQRGDNLAIVGPSGAGKSTLLQILGTLDSPTSGSVEVDGSNPFSLSEMEQARFRNQHIGFIFQDHHLLPQWNVLENTLLPALAFGRATQEHIDRARQLLERVGLNDRLTHLPSQLSGGERERVAVARALLLKPTMILADEPTGNLDSDNAAIIGELLLEIPKEQNAMLIVVTHSIELAHRMNRCYVLRQGKLSDRAVPS